MQPNIQSSIPVTHSSIGASERPALVWPDKHQEAWKFTPLAERGFAELNVASKTDEFLSHSEADIVISNGFVMSELQPKSGLEYSVISSDDEQISHWLGQLPQQHHLTALATQAISEMLVITVTPEYQQEGPVHLHFNGDGEKTSAHPFVVVQLEPGACFSMIESHHSQTELSAPVLVVDVKDNAQLHHLRLQNDDLSSSHLSLSHLTLGASSQAHSFNLVRGAKLSRTETHVEFSAEGGNLVLSSVYLGSDEQHHDITTVVGHERAHCASHQLIRGVLADSAHGVFQGKVRVAPDAQKTDGQQMSRALLLSRDAVADAKPELEIFADDVVCSHGATVGELDETLLFYLKSRGIPFGVARAMLIEAFVADALDDIRDKTLSAFIAPEIRKWATDHLAEVA